MSDICSKVFTEKRSLVRRKKNVHSDEEKINVKENLRLFSEVVTYEFIRQALTLEHLKLNA